MTIKGTVALAMVLAVCAGSADAKRARPARKAGAPQLQPLGRYQDWFGMRDYPQEAAIAREQGTSGFELEIDSNGLPADCKIIKPSGSKALDDRTCTIMMSRARFRPKLDAKGRPVSTIFRHSMIWKLPDRKQERTTDRSFDARSIIAPTGEVVSCSLTGAGASKIATSGGSCGPFGNREFFHLFMGDDYKKIRSTNVRMSVQFGAATPTDPTAVFQKTLAKAVIDIAPTGDMTNCTSLLKMEALGRTTNLCDFIRADPPRFPSAPSVRKGIISLDLLGYSR